MRRHDQRVTSMEVVKECYRRLLLALLSVLTIADGAIEITVTSPHIDRSMLTLRVPFGFRGTIAVCTTDESEAREIEWLQDDLSLHGNVISGDQLKDEENSTLLSAELISELGFFLPDIGNYACVVEKNSSTSNALDMKVISLRPTQNSSTSIACTVVTDSIDFAIRVLGTNCEAFEGYRFPIRFEFLNELILAILGQCPECAVTQNEISITDGPVCSKKVEEASFFQGTIFTTDKSRTSSIFCTLRGWQQTRPLVMINDTLYYIDETCALMVRNNSMPECGVEEGSVQHFLYIIGGITGVLLICLLTSACVFVTFKNGRPQPPCAHSDTSSASRQYSTNLIRQLTSKNRSSLGLGSVEKTPSNATRSSYRSDLRPLRSALKGSRQRSAPMQPTLIFCPPDSTNEEVHLPNDDEISQDTWSTTSSQWITGIRERTDGNLLTISQPLLGQHLAKRDSITRKGGNISLPTLSRYQSQSLQVYVEHSLSQHPSGLSIVISEPSNQALTQKQPQASTVTASDQAPLDQHPSQASLAGSEHHSQSFLSQHQSQASVATSEHHSLPPLSQLLSQTSEGAGVRQQNSKASIVSASDQAPLSEYQSQASVVAGVKQSPSILSSVMAQQNSEAAIVAGTNFSSYSLPTYHNMEAAVMAGTSSQHSLGMTGMFQTNSMASLNTQYLSQRESQLELADSVHTFGHTISTLNMPEDVPEPNTQKHKSLESLLLSREVPVTTETFGHPTPVENSTQITETPQSSMQVAPTKNLAQERETPYTSVQSTLMEDSTNTPQTGVLPASIEDLAETSQTGFQHAFKADLAEILQTSMQVAQTENSAQEEEIPYTSVQSTLMDDSTETPQTGVPPASTEETPQTGFHVIMADLAETLQTSMQEAPTENSAQEGEIPHTSEQSTLMEETPQTGMPPASTEETPQTGFHVIMADLAETLQTSMQEAPTENSAQEGEIPHTSEQSTLMEETPQTGMPPASTEETPQTGFHVIMADLAETLQTSMQEAPTENSAQEGEIPHTSEQSTLMEETPQTGMPPASTEETPQTGFHVFMADLAETLHTSTQEAPTENSAQEGEIPYTSVQSALMEDSTETPQTGVPPASTEETPQTGFHVFMADLAETLRTSIQVAPSAQEGEIPHTSAQSTLMEETPQTGMPPASTEETPQTGFHVFMADLAETLHTSMQVAPTENSAQEGEIPHTSVQSTLMEETTQTGMPPASQSTLMEEAPQTGMPPASTEETPQTGFQHVFEADLAETLQTSMQVALTENSAQEGEIPHTSAQSTLMEDSITTPLTGVPPASTEETPQTGFHVFMADLAETLHTSMQVAPTENSAQEGEIPHTSVQSTLMEETPQTGMPPASQSTLMEETPQTGMPPASTEETPQTDFQHVIKADLAETLQTSMQVTQTENSAQEGEIPYTNVQFALMEDSTETPQTGVPPASTEETPQTGFQHVFKADLAETLQTSMQVAQTENSAQERKIPHTSASMEDLQTGMPSTLAKDFAETLQTGLQHVLKEDLTETLRISMQHTATEGLTETLQTGMQHLTEISVQQGLTEDSADTPQTSMPPASTEDWAETLQISMPTEGSTKAPQTRVQQAQIESSTEEQGLTTDDSIETLKTDAQDATSENMATSDEEEQEDQNDTSDSSSHTPVAKTQSAVF